jgi:GNAT superfamily N-acetyltransferase
VQRILEDGYQLDDDVNRLDLDAIVAFLTTSAYWGRWRGREQIELQVSRSMLNVGVYGPDGAQIGYARVVTDGVAFAYLADVYILDAHRGHGLGKAMVAFTVEHGPSWRWVLHTQDAGGLYAQYGFGPPPVTLMERDSVPPALGSPAGAATGQQ